MRGLVCNTHQRAVSGSEVPVASNSDSGNTKGSKGNTGMLSITPLAKNQLRSPFFPILPWCHREGTQAKANRHVVLVAPAAHEHIWLCCRCHIFSAHFALGRACCR